MGKFISNFQTTAELESFSGTTNFQIPHVSLTKRNRQVHFFDAYNGHEYVDLGLPSGTLWATMNIGANSETEYGNYYMYGKGAETYVYGASVYTGSEDPLALSADTASQVWGGLWHMPTKTQLEELTANTTIQWVENYNGSGKNGGLFTSSNGKSVFFPAAGWVNGINPTYQGYGFDIWSSSPWKEYSTCMSMDYDTFTSPVVTEIGRHFGHSVRGVVG